MLLKLGSETVIASIALVAVSSVTTQPNDVSPLPLRSIFDKGSTPVGVIIPARPPGPGTGSTGPSHPLTSLDPTLVPEKDLTYVVFRAQEDVSVPCSRSLAPDCCRFGPGDPYQVELSAELRTADLGTSRTTKATWVRAVPGADLSSLAVRDLLGAPIIAAFDQRQLTGARYVALYRRTTQVESPPLSCNGHIHLQATWAVLPTTVKDRQ
jgi:hypothetical protein